MMILDVIKVVFAAVLILFMPGFFLVMALFPKKNELSEEDDWLFRIVLSVVLSIVVSIILAFIIVQFGVNEDTGKGYFTPFYIITSIIAVSVVFFVIGIIRGAYPIIFTPKRQRMAASLSKEEQVELKKKMERFRELELQAKQLSSNLDKDISYKAKKRFKKRTERTGDGIGDNIQGAQTL